MRSRQYWRFSSHCPARPALLDVLCVLHEIRTLDADLHDAVRYMLFQENLQRHPVHKRINQQAEWMV
jgi:hypothetical protein